VELWAWTVHLVQWLGQSPGHRDSGTGRDLYLRHREQGGRGVKLITHLRPVPLLCLFKHRQNFTFWRGICLSSEQTVYKGWLLTPILYWEVSIVRYFYIHDVSGVGFCLTLFDSHNTNKYFVSLFFLLRLVIVIGLESRPSWYFYGKPNTQNVLGSVPTVVINL
jgi:hypothetical protein